MEIFTVGDVKNTGIITGGFDSFRVVGENLPDWQAPTIARKAMPVLN
jgi:hypothetical protein